MHHTHGYLPAAFCELYPKERMAKLAGCKVHELVIMNGLTVNLHLLMLKFYKPTSERYKIVIEEAAFSSDMYAVKSELVYHGYSVEDGLIQLKPLPGTDIVEEKDVLEIIRREGQSIAILVLPSIQYYTGQMYDIETLTRAAHDQGCIVLCDAAHSIGNVSMDLHKWDVDCAVWCSYKYLNSGAGGIGAAYVHERYLSKLPAVHGWWGNDNRTKFEMKRDFEPVPFCADSYKLSNCPPLLIAPLMASLEIFERAGDDARYRKQRIITGYLEYLLDSVIQSGLSLITPRCLRRRGSMLSIKLDFTLESIHQHLQEKGVICDVRKPGTLRVTPCPLYNSFRDVWVFVQALKEITAQDSN
ncbi:kynureninase-like [Tropilaelaps mercedesae]|uniref:Kynureninase-like n=1 Tax=Tropilaelaps mercedesae TaxID=418985 RepID=A0A1V9XDK7_9ACAR|nr:kynureninase-like [Tropilaelaps mercedesae]